MTRPVTPAAHTPADRCAAMTVGVNGVYLGCDQIAGHVGPHVDGRAYWGPIATAAPSPARAAAAVWSDAETADALVLWARLRDDDGTLVETVARAIYDERNQCHLIHEDWSVPRLARYLAEATAAIAAVRGEVR